MVLFLIAMPAMAIHTWSADDVPIPYLKDSTQYVSDPDHFLSKESKDSANYFLQRLNVECGVQNLLVIVGNVKDADPFRMAQDLGNKLGVGYKKSRRGLVVVISVNDRKCFIAPGMGLEGELTDVDCDDISRACIVKNMRNGQMDEAVVSVSRALFNKVKSGRTGMVDIDEGPVNSEEDWGVIILFLLVIFGIPLYLLIRYFLEEFGVIHPKNKTFQQKRSRRPSDENDWLPPFFMGGGGFSSGTGPSGDDFSGGSFGGGSFGGGGAGGSW